MSPSRARLGTLLLAGLLVSASASADMLEIKGKGFVNGEILSEKDGVVTFKDNKGETWILQPEQVLYKEHTKPVPPAEVAFSSLHGFVRDTFQGVGSLVDAVIPKKSPFQFWTFESPKKESQMTGPELLAESNNMHKSLRERRRLRRLAEKKLTEEKGDYARV